MYDLPRGLKYDVKNLSPAFDFHSFMTWVTNSLETGKLTISPEIVRMLREREQLYEI